VRRLPDSPVERYAAAYRWNIEAKDGQISDGTVAWCAERYLASDRYTRLKPKTKANYKRNLDRLVDAWGHLPVTEITTGRVLRFTETFGEAGCSTAEIGAITGHSDQSVHRMMRTYLPKTFAMARNAITKLEKNR